MADANNKLRLQIVTQLDAAGIKATKEQVDNLELGLRRAGNAGGESGEKFGRLEKELGKLPGPIGKIGGALGGLAGQATMVIGALKLGVDIGNWIQEKCIAPLLGIKDPIDELKKENRAYDEELKRLKESLAEVTEAELKRMDASAAAGEKALKKIDEQTAAYFRQASALQGLTQAGNNAKLQQLEREKYENMRDYSTAGYSEAAEQIGKYYDVVIAEEKSKQKIEEFDRESVKLQRELASNEEAYAKAAERAANAKSDAEALERRLAEHRRKNGIGGNAMYDNDRDAMLDDQLEKLVDRARKGAEKADEVLRRRAEKLETVDADVMTRQMERANLVASESDNVLHAADAYDDFVNGNPNAPLLSSDFGTWGNDILKSAEDSYRVQDAILSEVRAFSAELKNLLVMGGGE